jgi:LPXTG-motif cell wall-anchored protein
MFTILRNFFMNKKIIGALSILTASSFFVATASPAFAYDSSSDVATSSAAFEMQRDGVSIADGVYTALEDEYQYDYSSNTSGWTGDSFDGFGYFRVFNDGCSTAFDFNMLNADSTVVEGGVSTFTFIGDTGSAFWNCFNDDSATFTLNATLTLSGTFAKWDYSITGTPGDTYINDLTAEISGNLGSDDTSIYSVSDNTMVSSDDNDGDTMLLWYADTASVGWDVTDGNDDVSLQTPAANPVSLIVGFRDYDDCSYQAAYDASLTDVASLPDLFGSDLAYYSCLSAGSVDMAAGETVVLPLALNDEVSWYFDNNNNLGDPAGFNPTEEQGYGYTGTVTGLPAGVTGEFSVNADLQPVLTLSGTPTETGSFTPQVSISTESYDSDNSIWDREYPLKAVGTVNVTGLPETGSSSNNVLAYAATMLLVGGAFVGMRKVLGKRA